MSSHFKAVGSKARMAIAFLLAAALLLLQMPPVQAAAEVVIDSPQALQSADFASGGVYRLTQDIDMSGVSWTPQTLGAQTTLRGDGFALIGLSAPLFDTVEGGTVERLGLVASDVTSSKKTCGLLANTLQSGRITACFAQGAVTYGGSGTLGGLIGVMNGGTVENAFVCVSLTATASAAVGGLIGTLSGGSVTGCYSTGDIRAESGKVAGLANTDDPALAQDTYAACQLLNVSTTSLPSGVNGLYDAQLSVLRESRENEGLKTAELISTTALSDRFAITGVSYPRLQVFYQQTWSETAMDAVRVSTAALSLRDIAQRQEPQSEGFFSRVDYMTLDFYAERTHDSGFSWLFDSALCKQYDSVPLTSGTLGAASSQGASWLTSRFCFSAAASQQKMTVTAGYASRAWYLTAADQNPYFSGGNGEEATPFSVGSAQELSNLRYYDCLGSAFYRLDTVIDGLTGFEPIDRFRGSLDGNALSGCAIKNLTISSDRLSAVGLFGTLEAGAQISNLLLQTVTVTTGSTVSASVGALAGVANGAQITDVFLSGDNRMVVQKGAAGGLIGTATDTDVENCLVSVTLQATSKIGGLIGVMDGGSVSGCGVSGEISGWQEIGGLIGAATDGAADSSYVTALVTSTATAEESAFLGGLIGSGDLSPKSCFFGGAVVADTDNDVGLLCGLSQAATDCIADESARLSASLPTNEATLQTTEELTVSRTAQDGWVYEAGYYPQRAVFAAHAVQAIQRLSALSAYPVYFQHNWQEGAAADMTTGASALYAYGSEPLTCGVSGGDGITFATDEQASLIRFEADASQVTDRLLRAAFTDQDGNRRVVAAARKGIAALQLSTQGTTVQGAAFVVRCESDSGTTETYWRLSDSEFHLYDLPLGGKVTLIPLLPSGCETQIAVNGESLSASDGVFVLSESLKTDMSVTVTLSLSDAPWGVRRVSD